MMPPLHRHSRRFITALCAAWAAWTTLAPLTAAPPPPQLTALLFYATDGDGSEAPEKMPETSGEIKRYEKALRQATTARHTGAPAAAVQSPPASNTASSWAARTCPGCPVGQWRKRPCDRRF